MKFQKYYFPFLIILCLAAVTSLSTSCKKNAILSKGNLNFSIDTLVFDTVFTTIGSTTKRFKFYNPSNQRLQVSEIELVGGPDSPFRINVDGYIGTYVSDIEMEPQDSLFIFVEVTLDVNAQNLPLIVEDQIRFKTNGKDQFVQLAVWGQDAYFHRNDIDNEGIWPNDKPHVIYGFAAVDSAKSLTIPAGTVIHLHKNSILYNYKGTLSIEGEAENKVIIQGDRLETEYQDVPGQYYGVYMQEARPSLIRHAEIKNGIAGIHVFSRDESFSGPTLTIENSEIFNHSRYGVFLYSGANIKAENTIIHSNGIHALLVLEGGTFDFNYCNLLSYGGSAQSPAVGISNYYVDNFKGQTNVGSIDGQINNSIIYGFQDEEIAFDTNRFDLAVNLNMSFDRNVIKWKDTSDSPTFKNTIWNKEPLFLDFGLRDFSPTTPSPMNNSANHAYYIPFDFFNQNRNASASDIGAVEKD
jgi:hypothetical protein